MSHIDELIQELCPDGVEYRKLGSVGTFVRGNGLQKSDLEASGFPAVHYGEIHTRYGVWTNKSYSFVSLSKAQRLRHATYGDLLIATTSEDNEAVAKATAWLGDNDVAVGGDAYIYHHRLEPKYVSYFFQSSLFQDQKRSSITGTKVRRISDRALGKIRIPVPPLEVQREIVRILDKFTALEAELEAELEARRTQRTHYWKSLLSPQPDWEETTVGGVAQIFDGPHATPKKTEEGPWYLSISSLKDGRFDFTESAHLSIEDLPKWTRRVSPRRGDTLFSYETRLGQAAYWDVDGSAALGRRMGLLRPDTSVIDPRFLTLVYLGPQFQSVIRSKTVSGSTVERIPIADMASWKLFIPRLGEQRRIVDVLDKFDALVNDLSIGLPAELSARRKQYEYYRDKLLTFKERA
jgi:type I restriction enzyme S subunit